MKPKLKFASLLGLGVLALGLLTLRLAADQPTLKLVTPKAPAGSGPMPLTLQLRGASNGVVYVIQSSTNLTTWQTVLAVKSKPGQAISVGDVAPTNGVKFFRLFQPSGLQPDTNAPVWTNGVNGQISVTSFTNVTVSWDAAVDDVGVSEYRLYFNGTLVTNVSALTLSYPFTWNMHKALDIRIQAADASGNASPVLPLLYIPGDSIMVVSDDQRNLYLFEYQQTNIFQTNAGFNTGNKFATVNSGNRGIGIGDFDRDGILDVVAGGANGDTLTPFFFKGKGDGTFFPPVALATTSGANSYMMDGTVGDFDGDGNLDFVVNGNNSFVYFYWGNGDGTFTLNVQNFGNYGRGMVAGDFNEDGREDIVRGENTDFVRLFLSNGDRTFTQSTNIVGRYGSDRYGVAAGDFDEDKHLDVIANNANSGDEVFYKGFGDTTFTALGTNGLWAELDIHDYSSMDAYDFDGDGHLDMVMSTYSSHSVYFWPGIGDGTFSTNAILVTTGVGNALGISAPPHPPRVDVNIKPLDSVIQLSNSVTYTAYGSGVTSNDFFRWTFGDQGTNRYAWTFDSITNNMGPVVTHLYTNEGRFVTRLLHTDSNGVLSVRGTYTTVKANPPVSNPGGPYNFDEHAAFQGNWTGTLSGTNSTDDFGIVSYIWNFGDGTFGTNSSPSITHTWTNSGLWNVTLIVVDGAGQMDTNSTTVTFTPNAPPVAVITGPDVVDETSAHNGVWTASFSAASSTDDVGIWKYFWNFGNGQTSANSSANPTYNAVGTYTVTLTVTDNAGQTNTTSKSVLIKANGLPVPIINGPHLLTVDVSTNGLWFGAWDGLSSTDDTGIYIYNWSFGDGATASGSSVTHNYSATGVYPLTLTVTDNGNQTATTSLQVVVVAGNPPVARITASTLAPEGQQPVVLSGANSTSDHGIQLYEWFLPPRTFDFYGQFLDPSQWSSANTVQNGLMTVTGQNNWGVSYFFSIGTEIRRGGSIQGRIDTPSSSSASYAMVGLKNLNTTSGQYGQYPYALYFNNGSVQIYENGGSRASPTNYDAGTAYDFRIETKPGAGARYYLRPSGSGQPFTLIYDSSNLSDAAFSFGADVNAGVWNFESFQVDGVFAPFRDITTPISPPGGTVTLVVVDSANLTNSTSIVITPVTGAGPVAVIAGPTTGQAGVELPFNGYGSTDDHAIATYTWDFGDGTPVTFGPAPTHHYGAPGTYTNTLTVADYAEQSSTAQLIVNITGSNSVVHVPWSIINGVEQSHIVYSGKTNSLKAVARGVPVPFTYTWDFGDGTGLITNAVTTSAPLYNLEAQHAYVAGDGTPFYATVQVLLTNGTVFSDTYPLIVQPKTLDTEEKVAIDEGLWYLQKAQNRYDFDPNTKGGDWTYGGYKINVTASAVQAFAINGHLMTDDASRDPYVDTVQRGVNYLLNNLTTVAIGPKPIGNPDSNNNGIGLNANSGYPIYETGPVMDCFVAVGRPELIAPTGGVNVKGRAFRDIVQDMVDMFTWGQYDDPVVGGGWRYGWQQFPDNSASQWGPIGMLAAERFWGIVAPAYVKPRNEIWLSYSEGPGGFGYTGVGDGHATTPSAMVQMSYDGITTTNALWTHGESYVANNWATIMGENNVYANYAIAKALRTANPVAVHNLAATGKDWFLDPVDGLARVTIDHQQTNGSWFSSQWVDPGTPGSHATAWSVLILSSSLFQQGPVAVITAAPNPSAVGFPVVFDGRGSYHQNPNYKIVDYRWIFDSSKGLDFDHPDAVGPVVTNVFSELGTNTVFLEVRDNNSPQLSDTASVVINTTIPPYPPTADAGGPYVVSTGQPVHLDGSGSFTVDESAGNFIQSWNWEVNYTVPVTFDQGVSGEFAVYTNGYPTAGTYQIGLEVKNANSITYPGSGVPDAAADAFTTVLVYNKVITDLKVRPKATKIQLTWTKVGDFGTVYRSQEGPDRGFTQIGQTDSTYATFLDTNIDYNTEYYYRVFAGVNGSPNPLGISDPIFVVSPPRSFDEHAPKFQSTPSRVAKVGQLYEVTLDAKSPENTPLYYSLLIGPTNMSVNLTNGDVQFTPTKDQIGNIFLSFQVTNNIGRDVLSYTLFVFPATNHTPVVNANGPYAALAGQPIQFSSAGSLDLDGNPLHFFWNFGDGTISTNPNPIHVYGGAGNYLATLFVNNGFGGTASAKTTVQITRPDVPPVAVVSNGPNFTVRLGETLTLDGSKSFSPLGNPITYAWNWGDGTILTNASNVVAHLYAAQGQFTGSLTVSDNRSESNTAAFNVTVGPSNQPPVVSFVYSPQNPPIGSTVTFDATATVSPDNDALNFTWDFGDHSKTTGPLVTHTFSQITNYTVTLTVTDDHGGVGTSSKDVQTVDAPPVFTSNPPLLVRAGAPYTYTPTVQDIAGGGVTYQLLVAPLTVSIDTNTGTLSWLPGTNDVGGNNIQLQVTDINGGTALQEFTIFVTTPLGLLVDLQPTHIDTTNLVVDSQTLAMSGTVRVYFINNGADTIPVPFTISVFLDNDFNGAFSTNADTVIGYGLAPPGFAGGETAYVEMTVSGQALFPGCPVYAYVDSQNTVTEYNESNNIARSGFDADTNNPPVVDLSASFLRADRTTLPAKAVLTARLGNSGLVPVPTNVPIAFYDGDPTNGGVLIAVTNSTIALNPGMYQDLSVDWPTPTITNHTVYVAADDPGNGTYVYNEITYSNNVFHFDENLAQILPPIAYAGPNQNVNVGDNVGLNGRGSQDPQGRPLTYRWSIVSIPIGSSAHLSATNSVSPSFTADAAGLYTVQLVVNNGILDSSNSIVQVLAIDTNVYTPPTITSIPSFLAIISVPYTYQVVATDPQSGPLSYRLPQGPAGMTINTNTGLVKWTPTNAGNVYVQVAVDGRGGSFYQGYTLNVIPFTNLPPQFTSTPVTLTPPSVPYSYTAVATSPVGNTISYALTANPAGMSINAQNGVVSWTPATNQLGGNLVTIQANDGHGGNAVQSYNLVVLLGGTNAPVVQPIPDQTVTAPAAFASFLLDNYVHDPNYPASQITWTVTGTNLLGVTIDSNRVVTVTYPAGVNVAEQVTFLATDPSGFSGFSAPTFTVIGSATPPVAAIANLSDTTTTSISTGTYEVFGTADDPGVPVPVAYRLGLYKSDGSFVADVTPGPLDAAGWHEGRVPAGGSLGTLDFTTIRNGAYTLQLDVKANGFVASATALIAIDSSLKLGQIKFSQQDLVLPVQGVGLQIVRTYDSFNTAAADFGYSWTYSVSDLNITVNEQRSTVQDIVDGPDFSLHSGGGWDVTLTMPDSGKTVTFKFGIAQGSFQSQAYWSPPAWVNASLTPTVSSTLITLPGLPPFWQVTGIDTDWQNFDWPGWVLTLQDGTKYVINRVDEGEHFFDDGSDTGYGGFVHAYSTPYLSEVILPSGAHTDFVRDGGGLVQNIAQYDATNHQVKSVLFSRDAQNRINGVYTPQHLAADGTPSGPADVLYTYDSISNLISAGKLTDGSNTNALIYATYTYSYTDAQFPHFLTQITDPRGVAILRAQFDSLGRLVGTLDAKGNLTSIDHSTASKTETIFDRLGNPTQLGYDDNGNITSRTDPLGNTTTMTYDANNNLTSTTDPLGHTTQYAADTSGNLTSLTDALGNQVSMVLSASGNPISYVDAMGHVITNNYDAAGHLTSVTDALGNTLQHKFDSAGNLTDIVDPSGVTTVHLSYDGGSHVSQALNSAGVPTTFGYDSNGHLNLRQSQWINPDNSNDVRTVTKQINYDSAGRITNMVDALGNSSSKFYDQLNNVIMSTDNRGNASSNAFDVTGNPIETVYPNGADSRTVYDANSRPILVVDPHLPGSIANGTQTVYDPNGNIISSVRLSNVVVQITASTLDSGMQVLQSSFASSSGVISSNYTVYDAAGHKIAFTDMAGQTTRYEYDAVGHQTAVIDALSNRTTFEYSAIGQKTAMIDPFGNETDFLYDAAGNRTRTVYANGATGGTSYLPGGQPIALTDPLGRVKSYSYNSAGAPYAITLPAVADPETGNASTNPVYLATYDVNVNLQQMIDPKGRATTYKYDQYGRVTSRILPLGQTEQTTFTPFGQAYHITDFDGQVTEFQYDNLGRRTGINYYPAGTNVASASLAYTFDPLGRMSQSTDSLGVTKQSYDLEGRLTQVASPQGTINYAYDAATGRRIRTYTDNSDTRYTYDELGRLKTLTVIKRNGETLSAPESTSYTYTPVGSRASVTLPNGVKTVYTYDQMNRLSQLQNLATNGGILSSFAYQYNPMNMRTSVVEVVQGADNLPHTNSIAYAYDGLDRLVSETATDLADGSKYQAAYTYDLVGNRLQRSIVTGGKRLTTYYSYDANDRLLTESNVVSTGASGSGNSGANAGPIKLFGPDGRTHLLYQPESMAVSYYALKSVPYVLLASFILPASVFLSRRRRATLRVFTLDLRPERGLFPRCLSGLLAALVFLMCFDSRVMANEAIFYAALTTDTWGLDGVVTNYQYDNNGSVTQKTTTGAKPETITYAYNIAKQLTSTTREYDLSGSHVVESTTHAYNSEMVRVQSTFATTVGGVSQGSSTNIYLLDMASRTGQPQVVEEFSAPGTKPTVSYTIGDDVIAQSSSPTGDATYFLKDGHDSTRQLVSSLGAITDYYSYDAFGIMLGGSPTPANPSTTKMLFAGEQFDSTLNLYNMRARFYDQGAGRFTTMDPYAGSPQDPASLHKYTYCKNNPVNFNDPSGLDFSLGEVIMVNCIIATLASIGGTVFSSVWSVLAGGSFAPDAAIWGVSASISGNLAVAAYANLLLEGLLRDSSSYNDQNDQNIHVGAAAGMGLFGLVEASVSAASGKFFGGTANIGAEAMATTKDGLTSLWTYFGPGIYLSISGGGNPIGASVAAYTGTVYNVDGWHDYSGPFEAISLGQNVLGVGWTVSWFCSPSNPMQNGTSTGLTLTVPPSGAGFALPDFGASYVTYQGIDVGQYTPDLLLQVYPSFWAPIMLVKWYKKIM